jgi:hypothetical protein
MQLKQKDFILFWPIKPNADGPPGAGCTLKHHSLDPNKAHGMIQQHLIRCIVAGNAISLDLDLLQTCQTFSHTADQNMACSDLIGDQELVSHWNITHWIHMEDMELFSSIFHMSSTCGRAYKICTCSPSDKLPTKFKSSSANQGNNIVVLGN